MTLSTGIMIGGFLLNILASVAAAFFIYGKLTQSVKHLAEAVGEIKKDCQTHWGITHYTSNMIAELKGRCDVVLRGKHAR